VLLLLCPTAHPLFAEDAPPRFSPANLGDEVREVLEGLNLPIRDGGGPLTIRCGTRVLSNGDSQRIICYPDAERGRLVQRYGIRITRALAGKEFTPAEVDGEKTWAWFNFSVVVFEADGKTRVRALPHHGANVETLGTARYVSPQRYTFPGWNCNLPRSVSRSTLMLAVVRVGADGAPLEVDYANASTDPPCLDRVSTMLMASSYIPAHVGGEPVEAFYLEFLNLGEGRGI